MSAYEIITIILALVTVFMNLPSLIVNMGMIKKDIKNNRPPRK